MSPPISSSRGYAGVVAATLLVALVAGTGLISGDGLAFGLLGLAVVLTGMPHGAVDHLVARQLFELEGLRGAVLFYGAYLAVAGLYGLLWWLAPGPALVLFLVIAAYHFGQADLAYLARGGSASRVLLYLSRGAFVVGSPLLVEPQAIAPVVSALARPAFAEYLSALGGSPGWVAVLAVQHAIVLLVCSRWKGRERWLGREGISVVVLGVSFAAAPPLVAFAVYFGLWHALGHVFVLLRFFRGGTAPRSGDVLAERAARGPQTVGTFYRQAALYTALPLLGLAAVVLLGPPLGAGAFLAALFVLISVLTLPHMLLVERLYRHLDGHGASPSPQAGTLEEGSSSRVSSGLTTKEGGSVEG